MRVVNKIAEGSPHVVTLIESGEVDLVINTPSGAAPAPTATRSARPRSSAGIPCITTITGASAAVSAIEAARRPRVTVRCLQDLHAATSGGGAA